MMVKMLIYSFSPLLESMSTEKKKKDITSVPVMHPIMEKGKILSTQFLLFYQTVIIILPPNFQRTLTNCRLKAQAINNGMREFHSISSKY